MRPPLRSVRMGFLKNIASPMRRGLGWRCEGVSGSARRGRVGNALFSVTPLTRSVSGECVGVWRMSMLCASKMRYYGSGVVVRRADPFSVNPGPRPGLEIGVGMHRKAVPL